MNLKFKSLVKSMFIAGALVGAVACSSDDKSPEVIDPKPNSGKQFQLAFASGSGSESYTYLQGVDNLSSGVISFDKKGYQMPSSRTSRIYVSDDGKYVYNLNYTVGDLRKYEHKGGQSYVQVGHIDSSVVIGVKTGRFTKLDEKQGSVHYIKAEPVYSDQEGKSGYLGHKMTAGIALIDMDAWAFKPGFQSSISVKLDEEHTKKGYYISRIDSPVLSNGKLYYGAAVSIFDPSTGKGKSVDKAFTLVVDANDLTQTAVITTTNVEGSTNGYRTPTLYKDEQGDILQMVNGKEKTFITKIVNGKYEGVSKFDLGAALGNKKVSSNGWFYVGKGIGYVPYQKLDEDQFEMGVNPEGVPTKTSVWGVARVDLNNNTAVDLDVPKGKLWLTQYQTSIVRDGKFYIALAEVSGKGNIYIFDVNSTSTKGTLGAEITSGVDQYYIGVY